MSGSRPINWLLRHVQVALSSLGRLTRQPLSTLLTAGVIAIAVALPTGFYLGIQAVRAFAGTLEGGASLSLFLAPETTLEQARDLTGTLQQHADIDGVRVISKDEALREFKSLSGFGQALDLLDENPLPTVLVVQAAADRVDSASTQNLAREMQTLAAVELVQVDLQWVARLQAITQVARRAVILLAGLFSLAVLLIVGNTIRLEIQHRRAEIEITKLVGATDAFIRRPFLYEGLWYGLLGAALAWGLVQSGSALLVGPLSQLTGLYNNTLIDIGLSLQPMLASLLGSPLLGLAGAWLAVGRHLQQISPK